MREDGGGYLKMKIRTSWGNSYNNKVREVVKEKRGVPLKTMTPSTPS